MYTEIPILTSNERIKEESGIHAYFGTIGVSSSHHMHSHTYYTLEIITAGHGTNYINQTAEKLYGGAVNFVRPSDIHYISSDADSPIEDISILFNETSVDSEYRTILYADHPLYYPSPDKFNQLCTYAKALMEYNNLDNATAKAATKLNFNMILILLAEFSGMENEIYKRKENAAFSALQYLDMHFRENPSLKTTASFVGMTPQYFSTYFKNKTGKKYIEHLNSLKINYALNALKMDFSITEICFASGFGSISNFNNLFMKYVGTTPSQYRKNIKAKK